jgi:hypothetical protein
MDMKMRLKKMESGMTGGRINVGSFSKDWKGSGLKIFKKGSVVKRTLGVKACRYARSHSQ